MIDDSMDVSMSPMEQLVTVHTLYRQAACLHISRRGAPCKALANDQLQGLAPYCAGDDLIIPGFAYSTAGSTSLELAHHFPVQDRPWP